MKTLKQFLLPKVICIIVTYNGERWIEKCISTIKEEKIDLEIVIIDNGSTDNTLKIIEQNFPFVKVIKSEKNLGFAAANNLGYNYAREIEAEYIYLLNQDTISFTDNIYKLIRETRKISNEKIGVISPVHLNDNGHSLDKQFESYINNNFSPNIVSDSLLGAKDTIYQIGFVNAAAWLIRMETITAVGGLFSSVFYHYGEDVNFIGRLKFHKYKNFYVTNTFIHHCREERKGMKSKDFLEKELFIKSRIKLFDINITLKEGIIGVFKYSLKLCINGNIKRSLILFFYPLMNYKQILKVRKSYLTKKII